MAGSQEQLKAMGAAVRVSEIALTPDEDKEYGGPTPDAIQAGRLWLDTRGDIDTPETTRSRSLGGRAHAFA